MFSLTTLAPYILQIPYFDGDNWPDIIEDVIKYCVQVALTSPPVQNRFYAVRPSQRRTRKQAAHP